MSKNPHYIAIYALREDWDYDLLAIATAELIARSPNCIEAFRHEAATIAVESDTLDFPAVYSKYSASYDMNLSSTNFEIRISTNRVYGFFEHRVFGDESAGGLWFKDNELIDYDGVFALPQDVAEALTKAGFTGDALCEPK